MGVLRPEGSLPPRVYWVRRAVVLLALVAVVVLAVVGIGALVRGGGDDTATGGGGTPTGSPAPQEQETEQETGTPVCATGDLTAELSADATSYPEGALPTFTLRLTNAGSVACLVDAGGPNQQVAITSGSDRIWASTDCAPAEPLQLLLAPGQADERQVQWDRVRSVEGCAGGQSTAQPGTYQAVLTLAGVVTEPVVFGLE